jgi:hypothetical protein
LDWFKPVGKFGVLEFLEVSATVLSIAFSLDEIKEEKLITIFMHIFVS